MRQVATGTAWFALAVGTLSLTAGAVRRFLPALPALPVVVPPPSVGLGVLLCGLALRLAEPASSRARGGPGSTACGLAAAAAGVGSVAGIPQLDVPPVDAGCLIAFGLAVVAINARRVKLGQLLAIITWAVALTSLLRYAYWLGRPPQGRVETTPVLAAAAFAAVGAGALVVRGDAGFLRDVMDRTVGGAIARRLLPGAVLVPLMLGSLGQVRIAGDVRSALAIAVVATIVTLCLLVWRNTTAMTRLDVARSAAQHNLESEKAVTERLRNLDTLKNEFLGIVAHDLRNPLVAIRSVTQVVLEAWEAMPETQKRDMLGTVGQTAEDMGQLVNDVLDVARIESGDVALDIGPLDVLALVRRSVEMVATAHKRKCAVIAPQKVPTAIGDEQQQWRVLTNLLSNAVKFSPENSPLEVHVSVAGRFVELAVRDYGPGIAPEHLALLFQRFSRVPGQSAPGSGLGLFICKGLVEAQGGRIRVDSQLGRGTTFAWTIPVA